MNRTTGLAAVLVTTLLSSCTNLSPDSVAVPRAAVARSPEVAAPAQPVSISTRPASTASSQLATYYRRLQNDLVNQHLMRTDGGSVDTPFTDTQLATGFIDVALHDEYTSDGTTLRAEATAASLRRWENPIRMAVEFGANVATEDQYTDYAMVNDYTRRLSSLSGVPITMTNSRPNFHVLFLDEDDRKGAADRIRELIPGIEQSSLDYALNLPREQLCLVISTFKPDGVTYNKALAIIRAEHPTLMKQACVHEELAQGMGLTNDSPRARPSIFNDDEEFALLTGYDEMLLRILYDSRLKVGMTADEAGPIVRRIASELTGNAT